MRKINSKKFWKGIERERKTRQIVIAVFVVFAVILGVFGVIDARKDLGTPRDFAIEGEAANEFVYIDVVAPAFVFAKKDSIKYYFVWDANDYIYIVDLQAKMVDKLESATPGNPVRISGYSKVITDEIKNVAISVYNSSIPADWERVNRANFESSFGKYYLWARDDLTNQMVFYVLGLIILSIGLAFLIAHLVIERRIRRITDGLSAEQAYLISQEVESPDTVVVGKSVFLTSNHVISMVKSLHIANYAEIAWVYFVEIRQNGILSSRAVNIFTRDLKSWNIPTIPYGKSKNAHLQIIEIIAQRNSNIIIGFTEENKVMMRNAGFKF
ncbi:MAG: hypothetical protein LBE83_02345 [Propionibacteriaceae bacterium]|jgi:hypothetical protein|nr:hypothetical protein [Propionibacteriaceae bacterium]